MSEKLLLNDNWLFYEGEIEMVQAQTKGPSYNQAKTEHYLAGPAARLFPAGTESILRSQRIAWTSVSFFILRVLRIRLLFM